MVEIRLLPKATSNLVLDRVQPVKRTSKRPRYMLFGALVVGGGGSQLILVATRWSHILMIGRMVASGGALRGMAALACRDGVSQL